MMRSILHKFPNKFSMKNLLFIW